MPQSAKKNEQLAPLIGEWSMAMTLEGRVWKAERKKPDFSPFEFSQRFTGTFSEDGKTIDGTGRSPTITTHGRRTST